MSACLHLLQVSCITQMICLHFSPASLRISLSSNISVSDDRLSKVIVHHSMYL